MSHGDSVRRLRRLRRLAFGVLRICLTRLGARLLCSGKPQDVRFPIVFVLKTTKKVVPSKTNRPSCPVVSGERDGFLLASLCTIETKNHTSWIGPSVAS